MLVPMQVAAHALANLALVPPPEGQKGSLTPLDVIGFVVVVLIVVLGGAYLWERRRRGQ
jgi:uncharacterized membrane protein YeiB